MSFTLLISRLFLPISGLADIDDFSSLTLVVFGLSMTLLEDHDNGEDHGFILRRYDVIFEVFHASRDKRVHSSIASSCQLHL